MVSARRDQDNVFPPLPTQIQIDGLGRAIARVEASLTRSRGNKRRRRLEERIEGLVANLDRLAKNMEAAA